MFCQTSRAHTLILPTLWLLHRMRDWSLDSASSHSGRESTPSSQVQVHVVGSAHPSAGSKWALPWDVVGIQVRAMSGSFVRALRAGGVWSGCLAGQCARWEGEGIGRLYSRESSGHAVEHAPEMLCGQIGSHKSPDQSHRRMRCTWVHAAVLQMAGPAGQLRHVPAMHASDCTIGPRRACTAVHQQAAVTRPSSKPRARLQGSTG